MKPYLRIFRAVSHDRTRAVLTIETKIGKSFTEACYQLPKRLQGHFNQWCAQIRKYLELTWQKKCRSLRNEFLSWFPLSCHINGNCWCVTWRT